MFRGFGVRVDARGSPPPPRTDLERERERKRRVYRIKCVGNDVCTCVKCSSGRWSTRKAAAVTLQHSEWNVDDREWNDRRAYDEEPSYCVPKMTAVCSPDARYVFCLSDFNFEKLIVYDQWRDEERTLAAVTEDEFVEEFGRFRIHSMHVLDDATIVVVLNDQPHVGRTRIRQHLDRPSGNFHLVRLQHDVVEGVFSCHWLHSLHEAESTVFLRADPEATAFTTINTTDIHYPQRTCRVLWAHLTARRRTMRVDDEAAVQGRTVDHGAVDGQVFGFFSYFFRAIVDPGEDGPLLQHNTSSIDFARLAVFDRESEATDEREIELHSTMKDYRGLQEKLLFPHVVKWTGSKCYVAAKSVRYGYQEVVYWLDVNEMVWHAFEKHFPFHVSDLAVGVDARSLNVLQYQPIVGSSSKKGYTHKRHVCVQLRHGGPQSLKLLSLFVVQKRCRNLRTFNALMDLMPYANIFSRMVQNLEIHYENPVDPDGENEDAFREALIERRDPDVPLDVVEQLLSMNLQAEVPAQVDDADRLIVAMNALKIQWMREASFQLFVSTSSVQNAVSRFVDVHRREQVEWKKRERDLPERKHAIVKFVAQEQARIADVVLRQDFRDLVSRQPSVAHGFLAAVGDERAAQEGR